VKGKMLTVTMTNPSLDSAVRTEMLLSSGNIVEGRGTLLTHEDMTAGNSFDHPNKVEMARLPVNVHGNIAEISIPKRAIVSLELKIA